MASEHLLPANFMQIMLSSKLKSKITVKELNSLI